MKEESFGIIPCRKVSDHWQVFLIQHHAGHWGFPKGHAETGETSLEAAKRELLEETGLKVSLLMNETPFQESYYSKTVTYYLAVVEGEERIQVQEVKDGGWFPLNAVHERLTYKNTRELWEEVKRNLLEFISP